MPDQQNESDESLALTILQSVISKAVSEKLGIVANEFGESTRNMPRAEARNARILLVSMIENGFAEFKTKALERIEKAARPE